MAWLKIDDNFIENDKIQPLRDRTFRVHVAGLCYCARNLTDGHISEKASKVLSVILEFPVKRHMPELVEAVLWHVDETGDGWWINDYLLYNPDADTVKKLREDRSAAGRRGAKNRWGDGNSHSNSHGNGYSNSLEQVLDAPVVSRPVPFEKRLKAVTADDEKTREVQKMMRHLSKVDEGTEGVLLALARKLPLSSIAKVRESCQTRKVGAGYAVNALQSELAELEETA